MYGVERFNGIIDRIMYTGPKVENNFFALHIVQRFYECNNLLNSTLYSEQAKLFSILYDLRTFDY